MRSSGDSQEGIVVSSVQSYDSIGARDLLDLEAAELGLRLLIAVG
jgi:hypothetical protein